MSGVTASHKVSEVKDFVYRQFGDEAGIQVNDTDVIRWVNIAIREIAKKESVKKIATTALSPGITQYSWPADILQVQSVRIDGRPIKQMSFQDAEMHITDNDPNNVLSDVPLIWYEYAGQFFLWPKPARANAVQIFYIPIAGKVAGMSDTIPVPDTYFNALLNLTISYAYELDENWTAAQQKNAQYAQQMSDSEDGSIEYQTYPTITVLPEDL